MQFPILPSIRHLSTSTRTLPSKLINNPIYFYALPLTTHKTFVYCKYTNKVFPNGKENFEVKLINKFSHVWHNFRNSKSTININIVSLVDKLLSKIPWLETCLLSIPSQKQITRILKNESGENVTNEVIIEKQLKSEDLIKIPVYFPSRLASQDIILDNLKPGLKSQYEIHKKGILKDLLLMPLTIPIALIPLIPNVPGFYLLYRIYCHIKVVSAIKHFAILMKESHLDMEAIDDLEEIYLKTKDIEVRDALLKRISGEIKEGEETKEKLLLSEDVASEICKALGDEDATDKLLVAIKQEKKILSKPSKNT